MTNTTANKNTIDRTRIKRDIASVLPQNCNTQSFIYIITGACQNLFALAPEAKLAIGYDPMQPEAIEAHADTIIALFCPETVAP